MRNRDSFGRHKQKTDLVNQLLNFIKLGKIKRKTKIKRKFEYRSIFLKREKSRGISIGKTN